MNLEINALNALQTLAYYTLKGAYGITDPPEGVEPEEWGGTYPQEIINETESIIHGLQRIINLVDDYNETTYKKY